MINIVRNIFSWLKHKRTTKSVLGYIIHMSGIITMLGLSIYWWRAWKHILDTIDAVLTAYKWSEWHGFYWLEALLEIPLHIFSEPIYCIQLMAISLVFAFTTNKEGYYQFGSNPSRSTAASGAGMATIFYFFKR